MNKLSLVRLFLTMYMDCLLYTSFLDFSRQYKLWQDKEKEIEQSVKTIVFYVIFVIICLLYTSQGMISVHREAGCCERSEQ